MQTDQTPFLEKIFFQQESRLARWGTITILASGLALFLSLFVIMVALGAVFGQFLVFIKFIFKPLAA